MVSNLRARGEIILRTSVSPLSSHLKRATLKYHHAPIHSNIDIISGILVQNEVSYDLQHPSIVALSSQTLPYILVLLLILSLGGNP